MVTITFEQNINIKKFRFRDILDFKDYLDRNFYFTKLMELDDSELTPTMREKIGETKKMNASRFTNV
ncbi:hypothetical protein KKD19_04725 [Patescibacteria group bacterium]|nr:hypothetical protein [Patescibacteria group bacterium]MBU4512513.1 hypothetical protein [Patescibacteria group bacterium]MCG2693508.1 hypothetical protein [Candidatus Parcubacteria bacterium]